MERAGPSLASRADGPVAVLAGSGGLGAARQLLNRDRNVRVVVDSITATPPSWSTRSSATGPQGRSSGGRMVDLIGDIDGERPRSAVPRDGALALAETGLHGAGEVVLTDIGLPRAVYEHAGVVGNVRSSGDGWRVRLAAADG